PQFQLPALRVQKPEALRRFPQRDGLHRPRVFGGADVEVHGCATIGGGRGERDSGGFDHALGGGVGFGDVDEGYGGGGGVGCAYCAES
ncbi:MAG: hypothetical protein Q9170_008365, partial [Blastenia crenularia]